jgi:hypothetical protein
MTDILKSKNFNFSEAVEVVCGTKISECQVVVGLLKVTVKLEVRQKYFGSDLPDRLNEGSLGTNVGNNYENRKHDSEASLRHVSDSTPSPRHDGFDISKRVFKDSRRKVMSCDGSNIQEFCKNGQQKTELGDKVVYPSTREISVKKVRPALC